MFLVAILTGYYIFTHLNKSNDEMMTNFYRNKLEKFKDDN